MDSDFFLNFAERAVWVCGSRYTCELSKPHTENVEGQGQGSSCASEGQRLPTE